MDVMSKSATALSSYMPTGYGPITTIHGVNEEEWLTVSRVYDELTRRDDSLNRFTFLEKELEKCVTFGGEEFPFEETKADQLTQKAYSLEVVTNVVTNVETRFLDDVRRMTNFEDVRRNKNDLDLTTEDLDVAKTYKCFQNKYAQAEVHQTFGHLQELEIADSKSQSCDGCGHTCLCDDDVTHVSVHLFDEMDRGEQCEGELFGYEMTKSGRREHSGPPKRMKTFGRNVVNCIGADPPGKRTV